MDWFSSVFRYFFHVTIYDIMIPECYHVWIFIVIRIVVFGYYFFTYSFNVINCSVQRSRAAQSAVAALDTHTPQINTQRTRG
jgi:hypothetical protein